MYFLTSGYFTSKLQKMQNVCKSSPYTGRFRGILKNLSKLHSFLTISWQDLEGARLVSFSTSWSLEIFPAWRVEVVLTTAVQPESHIATKDTGCLLLNEPLRDVVIKVSMVSTHFSGTILKSPSQHSWSCPCLALQIKVWLTYNANPYYFLSYEKRFRAACKHSAIFLYPSIVIGMLIQWAKQAD